MAVCVIGATWDTDSSEIGAACNVHCHFAPCPLNGEPASTAPVETIDEYGREEALRFWELRTKRQRPMWMHHGSWTDTRDHEGGSCWCNPEFFPAVDLAGGRCDG